MKYRPFAEMKYRLFAALACFGCAEAMCAEYGMGVSLDFDEPILYVPIDFGAKFRVEPFFSYSQQKSKTTVYGESSPYTVVASEDRSSSSIGVGLFGLGAVSESIGAYYGARIRLTTTENKLKYDGGTRPPGATLVPRKTTADGIALIPTFGLEYRFTPRFSVAGEATLTLSAIDGNDVDTKSAEAGTDIIVRYRF